MGTIGTLIPSFSKAHSKIRQRAVGEWLDILKSAQDSKCSTSCDHKTPELSSSTLDSNKKPFLWLNLACPVRIEQPKNGVCSAGQFRDLDDATYVKTVKPAQTAFAIVKYNEQDDSTLLLVRPATGRTHQIRIHLQYLQHQIANDPNYGGKLWFGNPAGERACEKAHKTFDIANENNASENDETTRGSNQSRVTPDKFTEQEVQRMADADPQREGESMHEFIQRTCVLCARMKGHEEERAHLEFLVRSPGLWLHALQYTVNGVSFRTELPQWTK
jgi:hypothetical protein